MGRTGDQSLKFMKIIRENLYDWLLFFSLFGIFLTFALSLDISAISLPFKICSSIADASLLTLLCSLMRGKWKRLTCILPLLIFLLTTANSIYFRFFNDLLPSSLYSVSGLGDPAIISNVEESIGLCHLVSLIFAIIPLIFLMFRSNRKKVSPGSSRVMIYTLLLICAVSWGCSLSGTIRRQMIYESQEKGSVTISDLLESVYPSNATGWMFFYANHNFTGYIIRVISQSGNGRRTLSEEDVRFLRTHISNTQAIPDIESDSIRDNLIFIVVESLPYCVLESVDSLLIPNLHSLISESGSIMKRCEVLADYGRSSDAQLIYNTGLLPLRKEPFVTRFALNDYPSLSKAIGGTSIEVIGENSSLWSHGATTKSYGFTSLISGLAVNKINQDSIIFDRALKVIETESPQYLFVTTISMHNPYNTENVTTTLTGNLTISDPRDREYLLRLSHFDSALGRFISGLKRLEKYDKSLIVIAGDHEISKESVSSDLWDNVIPFIILNSPLKSPCERSRYTQLDVFPSIMDAMGLKYRYIGVDYRGLGLSIFSKSGIEKEITDTDYEVSEMIIKSRRVTSALSL